MSGDEPARVDFPVGPDGRRSTSALGRAVVADALRQVSPAAAVEAERESNWRSGYLTHFRALIEAGLPTQQAALSVARDGLASLHEQMRVAGPGRAETEKGKAETEKGKAETEKGGAETSLAALISAPARHELTTVTVAGSGTAEGELSLPYHGERLRGSALQRRLDTWVSEGVIEPSCAAAVQAVAANPGWLALPGRTVVALGAGAEIGPLPILLGWGARVVGVDLPRPAIWSRILETARRSGGTLVVPVAHDAANRNRNRADDAGRNRADDAGRNRADDAGRSQADATDADLASRAGFDLAGDVPAVADWLAGLDGPLVLGNYVYADGADNVRVASAVDALTVRLLAARPDLALGFLATPTDVFAVPGDAVAQSARAYLMRPVAARLGGWPLRALSGGRLLRRAYPHDADPGVCDSLIAQQGPNYALAKRLQRWRATVARDGGAVVSMNVAPPTLTRSVTKNRVLAAAYAGAHRFGVEVFEPATTRTLMAALLVYDLHAGGAAQPHPWQDEAHAAAHGGLWRIAYTPRSALGLATLLGYAATTGRASSQGTGGVPRAGRPARSD